MQEKYSSFIVENLPEILLPTNFYRNVSEFTDGDTLNIPTIGTVTLQDASEGVPLDFNPIDSGRVTLSITDQIGDAWGVTDDLKEDGYLVNQLMAARAMESTRAISEERETKFLAACNDAQTADDPNTINGGFHRIVANGTDRVITLEDFAYMAYAFNKAKVRMGGRIAIVTPEVAQTMSNLYNSSWVTNNPAFEGIITTGFAQDHKFVANVHGWDCWVSNLLPEVGVEANLTDYEGNTTASVAGDKTNIFMCVSDDQTTPMMFAERRSPTVEAWRDHEERTDKYQVTERYGWGAQRVDTLGVVITNGSSF
jgi:hypothetical protein